MLQMLSQEILWLNVWKWLSKLVKAAEIVSNFIMRDEDAAWR